MSVCLWIGLAQYNIMLDAVATAAGNDHCYCSQRGVALTGGAERHKYNNNNDKKKTNHHDQLHVNNRR